MTAEPTTRPRLTTLSHGAGCACKLGLADLETVLGQLPGVAHPDLVVGTAPGDDAAVWRRPDGSTLVATTDFFTPVVDDPVVWGQIAAANAASDVYAMGGRPMFALNVVGWPQDRGFDELVAVMEAAAGMAAKGGWVVVGGHTIDSAEPFYGQAVIGEAPADRLLTADAGRPGDELVLTKPIGTGIVMTAAKGSPPEAVAPGGSVYDAYQAAVASMTTLNDRAAAVAAEAGASAATDVTGFGLLGHLHRLAAASGVGAVVTVDAVPLLSGVEGLRDAGFVPGGTRRNMAYARGHLTSDVPDDALALLADAQTSGGLLFACPRQAAPQAVASLERDGHRAAVVGRLEDGRPGSLRLE